MKVEQAHAILLQNPSEGDFFRRGGVDLRIIRTFLKEIVCGNLDRIEQNQFKDPVVNLCVYVDEQRSGNFNE
jgi:hypothetical protein